MDYIDIKFETPLTKELRIISVPLCPLYLQYLFELGFKVREVLGVR